MDDMMKDMITATVGNYAQQLTAAKSLKEALPILRTASKEFMPILLMSPMWMPPRAHLAATIRSGLDMIIPTLVATDQAALTEQLTKATAKIPPATDLVKLADRMAPSYASIRQKVTEKGIDHVAGELLEARERWAKFMPGIARLLNTLNLNPGETIEQSFKRGLEEIMTKSDSQLMAEMRRDFSYIPLDKIEALRQETVTKASPLKLATALALFTVEITPEKIADLAHNGLGLVSRAALALAGSEEADADLKLPDDLMADFKAYGQDLVAIVSAARDALDLADVPIISRFQEIIDETAANRKAAAAVQDAAPKAVKPRRSAPKTGRRKTGPKAG